MDKLRVEGEDNMDAKTMEVTLTSNTIPSQEDEKDLQWPILLVPEVLEHVFKGFRYWELMGFRGVCTAWNSEICRILTTNPEQQIQGRFGFECFSTMSTFKFNPRKYEELKTLLKKSKNPGILFKEVDVPSDMNFPTGLPPTENLFKEFGALAKSLAIRKEVGLEIVGAFLAHETPFCPNVEMLDYFASEYEPFNLPVFQTPLKLKELRFQTAEDLESPEHVVLLLKSILQNSPVLTHLHIESFDSKAMEGFFRELQTLPSLTSNLTSLSTSTENVSYFNTLAKCTFTSQMKIVKFHFPRDLDDDLVLDDGRLRSEKDLMDFITLVAGSLEEFELFVEQLEENYDGSFIYPKDLNYFPAMPKLKELTLENCTLQNITQLIFLKKLPSLRVLNLFEIKEDVDMVHHLKYLSRSRFFHNTLEEINFRRSCHYLYFDTSESLLYLNEIFPRFTDLYVKMEDFLSDGGVNEQQLHLEEYFQAISQMQHLKTLYILLDGLAETSVYELLDLTQAFAYLKETPELEAVFIKNSGELMFNFPREAWIMQLLSAPKLRKVKIYGFTMRNESEYTYRICRYTGKKIPYPCPKKRKVNSGESVEDDWYEQIVQTFAAKGITYLEMEHSYYL